MSRYDPNSAQASRVPVKFCKSFPGVEDADYDGHSLSMLQRIASALGNRFPSPLWQKPASRLLPRTVWPPPSAVWKSKNMSVPAKHGLWQPNMARGRRPRPCGRRPRPCGRRDKLSVARTLPRGAEQNGCAADPSSVADGQAPLRLPDGLWRTKQAGCGRASPLGRCLARVGGPCHRLAPIRQSNPNHLVEIFQRQPEMRIELRARGVNVKGSRKKTVSTGAHA